MKDKIILKIWKNPNIEAYIKSICYNDWQELRSEFIVQILKVEESKLATADRGGFLEYLCFKIIKRITLGNIKDTGIFNKKSKGWVELDGMDIEVESEEFSARLNEIWEIVDSSHWYDKILFKAYFSEGLNYRQISEKYGINAKSIYYAVNKMKNKIKSNLNDRDN